ncbi:hypothetical protein TNCV_4804601 [Trichonephila clavipes]|nr:hypothetical protein TNCV_4804601 [Trichonephila clavipes]
MTASQRLPILSTRLSNSFEVRVPIPHSASVSAVGCSPEDLLNIGILVWPCVVIHKNEVWSNSTLEPTHMRKDHLLTIAISDYQASIENVELSPPIQHDSPRDNSRTIVTTSFLDIT